MRTNEQLKVPSLSIEAAGDVGGEAMKGHVSVLDGCRGTGMRGVNYAKRLPPFALARRSTFHYERHGIEWGKRLTRRRVAR